MIKYLFKRLKERKSINKLDFISKLKNKQK